MPVTVRPNGVHPTRDRAVLTEPWTSQEVREAARANDRPLSQKAVPGTQKHAKLLAAGARIYQQCPPLEVDAATDEVRAWCAEHAALPVADLRSVDVSSLWVEWYEVIHRGWSPTAPREQLLDLFCDLVDEIDLARSVVCEVDGTVVAAAFVFPDDQPCEVLTEAVLPEHPMARQAVASCMAAALSAAEGTVRFDGHVGDPHFAPLWQTVPGVYAGPDDPLDLLEVVGD